MKINYNTYYWQDGFIRLRPATIEDWKEFYTNYFDSSARFLLDSHIELPLTEEGAKEVWTDFIESSKKTGRINLTIETLEGVNVGSLGLAGIDERNGTFGIGIQVGREYRGKGYGTAAMKMLLDYAFNERRLNKFQTFVMEGNIASGTMMEKLGCIKEGVHRGTTYHQGRYWDEIYYGLFAHEFNELYKK